MIEDELRSWFRLSKLEISPRRAAALLEVFGSPEAIFAAGEAELRAVDGIGERVVEKLLAPEPESLDEELDGLINRGIEIITISDPDYPVNLKQIYDPPIALYVRGSFIESDRFAVAIVGSRRASVYGRSMAAKIAHDLAARGIVVVSGGARGIDSEAHKGALSAGGRTVAVLGCGIDVDYPPENSELFGRIAEAGAVVSEFPPGAQPEAWRFPGRNRIVSGLALGVLVIQAPSDSGALITSTYAAEQGRDVFALPGNVDDMRNEGCHALIRDGAQLVTSADDVLESLGFLTVEERSPQTGAALDLLSDTERKIVEILSLQPKHVDQVIQESELSVGEVTGALTMLEMNGIVKRVPGNAYVRTL